MINNLLGAATLAPALLISLPLPVLSLTFSLSLPLTNALPTTSSTAAISAPTTATAAFPLVRLGNASTFAILSGSAGITSIGNTVITGNLGTSGTSVTGFPPGIVAGGTKHVTDTLALAAHADANTAYAQAASLPTDYNYSTQTALTGKTLYPGVYTSATVFTLGGSLTLNGNGTNGAFVFQSGTALGINLNSQVVLAGGAVAGNVFWQVGSSATLAVGVQFVGTVLAYGGIAVKTGASVNGRLIANTMSVTLQGNAVTVPAV